MHMAARWYGEIKTVVFLIEEFEIDPAVERKDGRNAFLWACRYGKIETVKYLAEQYPKLLNSVDDDNENGLHLATRSGKIDIVTFLIEKLEMDPAVKGEFGKNPFLLACYESSLISYDMTTMDCMWLLG